MTRTDLTYRDFCFPLNVFMHILTREEGAVSSLHYGLFDSPDDSIATAQERSTELLFSRLPPAPGRLLDAGCGFGATLGKMLDTGYEARGITPDPGQVEMARARFGEDFPVTCVPFEAFDDPRPFDAVIFQESAQYIPAEEIFSKCSRMTSRVVVLDEFALEPVAIEGALPQLDGFLKAAAANGFRKVEELDLSAKAAPSTQYFMGRFSRYRRELVADLGVTDAQIDHLIVNGARYTSLYAKGSYGYRLLRFER